MRGPSSSVGSSVGSSRRRPVGRLRVRAGGAGASSSSLLPVALFDLVAQRVELARRYGALADVSVAFAAFHGDPTRRIRCTSTVMAP